MLLAGWKPLSALTALDAQELRMAQRLLAVDNQRTNRTLRISSARSHDRILLGRLGLADRPAGNDKAISQMAAALTSGQQRPVLAALMKAGQGSRLQQSQVDRVARALLLSSTESN
ncbi:MAG: hypothetical protein E5Y12_28825 [Mesorhizobium sp.]|nr:MAG: hypothetical protein E5Y12_28825 [Mesorhizobium sp.]